MSWDVTDRETAAGFDRDGRPVRLVKKAIVAGDLHFVADTSVEKGGDAESRDSTTYAARLVVEAATLMPRVADDASGARDLLRAALPHLPEDLAAKVSQFVKNGGPAATFNPPRKSM